MNFFFMICPWAFAFLAITGVTMALPELEDHLATHGVDPALSNHMVQNGWTTQNFSVIVDSISGFTDEIWTELSESPISLVQRSNLKIAWQQLQTAAVLPGRELQTGAAASAAGVPQEARGQNLLPQKFNRVQLPSSKSNFWWTTQVKFLRRKRCHPRVCCHLPIISMASKNIDGSRGNSG